jgi:hypothetical protein
MNKLLILAAAAIALQIVGLKDSFASDKHLATANSTAVCIDLGAALVLADAWEISHDMNDVYDLVAGIKGADGYNKCAVVSSDATVTPVKGWHLSPETVINGHSWTDAVYEIADPSNSALAHAYVSQVMQSR